MMNPPCFNINEINLEKLERLKEKRFDTVVFFYGQMTKSSYNGVRELALGICARQAVGIDMRGKVETFLLSDIAFSAPVVNG